MDRDQEARRLFETDWGGGIRLHEIVQRPWEYRYRLRFKTGGGQPFTLVIDPGELILRPGAMPSAEAVIRKALETAR